MAAGRLEEAEEGQAAPTRRAVVITLRLRILDAGDPMIPPALRGAGLDQLRRDARLREFSSNAEALTATALPWSR